METSQAPTISQKEYLKKYFSKTKTNTKKKKVKLSSSSHLKRSQIIDDDLNLNSIANIDDEVFNFEYLGDEAPQIAGVVDERPDHVIAMEVYSDSKKWKSISEEPGGDIASTSNLNQLKAIKSSNSNVNSHSKTQVPEKIESLHRHIKIDHRLQRKGSDSDLSPSRDIRINEKTRFEGLNSDQSPPSRNVSKSKSWRGYDKNAISSSRKSHKRDSIVDLSPQRKNNDSKDSVRDSDQSPVRKYRAKEKLRRKDSDNDHSPPRKSKMNDKYYNRDSDSDSFPSKSAANVNQNRGKYSDSHQSPSRRNTSKEKQRRKRDSESDQSPPRRNMPKEKQRRRRDFDSDQSPPRINKSKEKRRRDSDSDQSPPRRNMSKENERRRGDSDSYQSPPRRNLSKEKQSRRRDSDSDQSPPRKQISKEKQRRKRDSDSDQSPPRKQISKEKQRRKRDSDSDQSPPRRNMLKEKQRWKKGSDSDQSPPRRNTFKEKPTRRRDSDSDQSPPRKNSMHVKSRRRSSDSDQSPARKNYYDSSRKFVVRARNEGLREYEKEYKQTPRDKFVKSSPDRSKSPLRSKENNKNSSKKNVPFDKDKNYDSKTESKKSSKMEKTLEGKKAGLQDAKNLREELASLKEQEDKLFKNMDSSKYGFGKGAVMRDRKTGKIKDLAKEQEESEEKKKERLAREEKYSKWGKGLKQLEDANVKRVDAVYEMSKPLARYKDDNDLDDFLKAQEREGDPMLDYIKRKQRESHPVEKLKPRYEGSFAPNRFNIRPGHRWDGVERSNGYEVKWFENINSKKALQEDAYKWSSADM